MSPTPTVRPLDQLLCFDLYAASRAVTAFYRPMLDELGLTYPQYLVLVTLEPGRPCSVRELADLLHLDHATLTPMLRRMEGAGVLDRRRSTSDERVVEISLTSVGEALRDRFDDVQCTVGEAVGLDQQEFVELQRSLRRVVGAVADFRDK